MEVTNESSLNNTVPVVESVEKKRCVFVSKQGKQCTKMCEGEMCKMHLFQTNKPEVFDETLGKQCTNVNKSGVRCMLVCVDGEELCKMHCDQSKKRIPVAESEQCTYVTKSGRKCTHRAEGDFCSMHTFQIKGVTKEGKVSERSLEYNTKKKVLALTKELMSSNKLTPEVTMVATIMTLLVDKLDDKPSKPTKPKTVPKTYPVVKDIITRTSFVKGTRKELPDEERCVHINKKTQSRCFKHRCEGSELCSMHEFQKLNPHPHLLKKKEEEPTVFVIPAPVVVSTEEPVVVQGI